MDNDLLVQNGALIGYALVGVIALVALVVIQLFRRRGDVKKARTAVRLASHSINAPRVGPIAVDGIYHEKPDRYLDVGGQRIALAGELEVMRGTSARWRNGVRTYGVRDGDAVIAIGVMAKRDGGWQLAPSREEPGIQFFARKPTAAPPPLFPWRAPLLLIVCGGIAFGGLYGVGTVLIDEKVAPPCPADTLRKFAMAAALPLVRNEALSKYERCTKK